MREELTQKIIMGLHNYELAEDVMQKIYNDLTIILSDYEIGRRETALAVNYEDKNTQYLKKFITAKIVKGCTDRTIEAYTKELTKILEKIGKFVDEITADDIRFYLAIRQKKDNVSNRTVDNELRYMRSFFGYLVREELLTRDPTAKIERIKYEKKKKKAFTDFEIELMRSGCETMLDRAILETLLSTGCRVSELVQMKKVDICENRESILVHGKGNKERIVYLNARAVVALEQYMKERKDNNPYIFPEGVGVAVSKKSLTKTAMKEWHKYPELIKESGHLDIATIRSRVRAIGERVGVKEVHPHKFRRTCATVALRRGMQLMQVSKMLGHESVATTQIYLDLSEEELQQAHRKYVI